MKTKIFLLFCIFFACACKNANPPGNIENAQKQAENSDIFDKIELKDSVLYVYDKPSGTFIKNEFFTQKILYLCN